MGEKTAGVGHFTIPTMPAAGTGVTSGAANTLTTTYVALGTSAAAIYITGIVTEALVSTAVPTYCAVQIASGTTGAETIIDQQNLPIMMVGNVGATGLRIGSYVPIIPPVPVATTVRLAAKTADSVGSLPWLLQLTCINQSNVVDDGVAVGSVAGAVGSVTGSVGSVVAGVNVTAVAGTTSKGAAGYVGIDWAQINAPTTVQGLTGTTISATQAVASVTGAVGSVTGSVGSISGITFPTNFSALAITTAGAGGKVTTTDAYPTNFTSLAITTAGAVTVGTNNDKTGYALTQTFPTNFSAIAITTAGAVLTQDTYPTNFTSLAITTGGHISNVDTLTTYTGNTPQTGDSFARIGVAGAGLTNIGAVTVGTNNDKTGYSLTQSFPGNFATMSIDTNGNVAMTSNVKKNTAFNNFMFLMTDSVNHLPLAGATVTAKRSLDGAAFGACANAATEISNGWYKINLAATDTNANRVALLFTATGADNTNIEINTQP